MSSFWLAAPAILHVAILSKKIELSGQGHTKMTVTTSTFLLSNQWFLSCIKVKSWTRYLTFFVRRLVDDIIYEDMMYRTYFCSKVRLKLYQGYYSTATIGVIVTLVKELKGSTLRNRDQDEVN